MYVADRIFTQQEETACGCVEGKAHPGWGGGAAELKPPNPKKLKFKKHAFVAIMISKVLRDLPFSRNQPLKSADEWYIKILESKLLK
jgi:hypothetical protein